MLAVGDAAVSAFASALAFDAGTFAFVAVFAFAVCSGEAAVEAAEFALASGEDAGAGDSAGAAVVSKTERLPVNAGCDNKNANSINAIAAPIVIFAKIVCVPRGPKAVLEMLLVNSAPASAFPGCKRTAATKMMQDKMNKPYKI